MAYCDFEGQGLATKSSYLKLKINEIDSFFVSTPNAHKIDSLHRQFNSLESFETQQKLLSEKFKC